MDRLENMKKLKLVSLVSLLLLASCGNNEQSEQKIVNSGVPPREQFLDEIKKLENEIQKSSVINNVTAGLAIKAYTDYAGFFPDDSISPDYLFKAGEIATATQQYPQALIYYKEITDKYPGYKHAQESFYLQGYLLDNYLNDDPKAKIIYEYIIAKYPTSTLAMDAKAAISNLGKTDEELIKEFKRKNERNQTSN